MTIKEVAAHLGVCTATVYKLCDRGQLSSLRILNSIRVRARDLDALIRG